MDQDAPGRPVLHSEQVISARRGGGPTSTEDVPHLINQLLVFEVFGFDFG